MLFGLIKPNDWKIIHVESTEYEVQTTYGNAYRSIDIGEPYKRTAIAQLMYSKSRDKYKIGYAGWKPNDYSSCIAYNRCLQKQIELTNNGEY